MPERIAQGLGGDALQFRHADRIEFAGRTVDVHCKRNACVCGPALTYQLQAIGKSALRSCWLLASSYLRPEASNLI
jgi:hypothetical protein